MYEILIAFFFFAILITMYKFFMERILILTSSKRGRAMDYYQHKYI